MSDRGLPTDRRSHWRAIYAAKAENEVSWFQERPAASLALIGGSGLGVSARVVDVGGGASRLVDLLLADGWSALTVLDIAPEALAMARRRLGTVADRVQWLATDVLRWTPPRTFDLWHDRAVFHFLVDPADRAAYAKVMAAAVRPGGYAVIGTFAADGPERCSGLPVRRYDAAGLAAEFAMDFKPDATMSEEHRTPGGAIQRFQFVRLRRAE